MENAKDKGVLVNQVITGSPASKAGLQAGDIITKVDDKVLANMDGSNLIHFKKRIESFGIGGEPALTISRDKNELIARPKLIAKLLKEVKEPVSSVVSPEIDRKKAQMPFLDFVCKNERYQEIVHSVLQRTGEEAYVREGFQWEKKTNPYRLSLIDYFMQHPLETARIGKAICENVLKKDILDQIHFLAELLDIRFPAFTEKRDVSDSLQQQLQSVIDHLASCVTLIREAFNALSPEECDFLRKYGPAVWHPDERIEDQKLSRFLELSLKVDLSKLFEAATILLKEADRIAKTPPEGTRINLTALHLPHSIQSEDFSLYAEKINSKDFDGDILLAQNTRVGTIVVGGPGASYYYSDAAVIIDLGGNDYYYNNAGSSNKTIPISLCIDFSGNDVYNTTNSFAQGTGSFGIGVLADLGGNDAYLSQNYSQGSCLFGIGIALDNQGNDLYRGHALNQGVGFFGIGMLCDLEGNDVYFSREYAQGVGFTKGVGVLLDDTGNDFYFTGGEYPDFRDPEKSFQSMSQGMGMGIRPEGSIVGASGGIGLLIDQKGTDRYHGDYFSQGSGYYYSLGILSDNEGRDIYFAGRYAQGAGIHSAIGLLRDTLGDDTYECSFGVSQGCGHDTGIGFLVDSYGDDVYRSMIFSQGAGLEKGIGILADFSGNDGYHGQNNCQGISVPSKTEKIDSIGMLIDNQGDNDIFHDPIKENVLVFRPNGGLVLNK
ncbi:MAG: PDZ domain-containing protein [Candidatus Brocadiaceae bacterium]|nr:PDZ domain-containing protein [Candidatus Brocadiaceae bacterium]